MRSIDHESCDACGTHVRAVALVWNIPVTTRDPITALPNVGYHGELTLCGHHADRYALTFTAAGYHVHDTRLYTREHAA